MHEKQFIIDYVDFQDYIDFPDCLKNNLITDCTDYAAFRNYVGEKKKIVTETTLVMLISKITLKMVSALTMLTALIFNTL